MSITDELRKWVKSLYTPNSATVKDEGERIADRIDAEHERPCSRSRSNGYSDGFNDGFNDIESWVIDHKDEMAEHGWVRGPIGADGKLMAKEHMVVDNGGDVGVIVETRFNDSNWFVLVDFGEGDSCRFTWFLPKSLTHYHAPTVEDVLTEFGIDWEHESDCEDRAALLKEYAAKLQLKEDE